MLGVARELTVVLHALWQNKALGPRLSASYTFVHMYTVPFRLYLLYDSEILVPTTALFN